AQSPAERSRVDQHLTSQHVDGAMLLSLHDHDPLPALVGDRRPPAVFGGRPARMLPAPDDGICFVDVDNIGGARLATEHLVATGRHHIATIPGPLDMGVGVARLEGWRAAVTGGGLDDTGDLVAYGDFSEESG